MSILKKITFTIQPIVCRWAIGYRTLRLNYEACSQVSKAVTMTYEACPYSRLYQFDDYEAYCDGAKCAVEEMGQRVHNLKIRKNNLPRYV